VIEAPEEDSQMRDRVKEMQEVLAGRSPITPDDLPPFGARVTTTQGSVGEILGWYGPTGGPSSIDKQRMAFAILIDSAGACPDLPEGKNGFLGYLFESWIAKAEPQRFPRFAGWVREIAVAGTLGIKPPSELRRQLNGD
jgi:hypothetical protein